MAGYGRATKFRPDVPERQYAITSPRLGFPLTGPVGTGFYRGALEILFQVNVQSQFAPDDRYAAGGCALVRWSFLTGTRFVPYVDYGSGYMLTDYGLPEEGGKFGFELEGGLGAQLFLTDGVAITAETRFHHFSNSAIYKPNLGINSVMFLTGVSVFF